MKRQIKSQLFIIFLSIVVVCGYSALAFDSNFVKYNKTHEQSYSVYVCDSKNSIAYHSSNDCSGLNRCTHEIVKMSETEAKQTGRRRCKLCW